MPSLQTAYTSVAPVAFEGMRANMEEWNVITRTVETAAGIAFGRAVMQGAADHGVVLGGSGRFIGITVLDQAVDPNPNRGTVQTTNMYPQYSSAGVMDFGVIWVIPSASVAINDPVYFVPATGVLTNVSTANTLIVNARFDSTAASGALVKVRLR
jgi:hypothetical protein